MTRHHAEPNINILLTKNLPFDSYEAKSWAKSNKRKPDKINELILKAKIDLEEGPDNI